MRGFVLDKETKAPLANASIDVDGINHTIRSADDGDYRRLLAPGTYTITATIPGYNINKQCPVENWFNPLPDEKILDWSKLKEIADDILKCIEIGK